MRTLALTLLLVLSASTPALAVGGNPSKDASSGFPIAIVSILVAAVVLALVWRAVSRRKHGASRD